ncbi:MAG: hypothetical protein FWD77_04050 [Betaproteobacteria bacterium]|nr:hypothetical protein [Betaproteobacteria bacterium]
MGTGEEAEAQIQIKGAYFISGSGRTPVSGDIEDLLENKAKVSASDEQKDASHSTDAGSIVIAGMISHTQFITEWGLLASDATGIGGKFNQWLTGDPRGFCFHQSDCNRFTSEVVMAITGDGGQWQHRESAADRNVVLGAVLVSALENVLTPFYSVRPARIPSSGGKD